MQITLIRENEIITQILPQKIVGQYTINAFIENKHTKIALIEAVNEKWMLKSGNQVRIISPSGKQVKICELVENTFIKVLISKSNEKALVFAEPVTKDRSFYRKVIFPLRCTINIGRDANNDIIYTSKYASSRHAQIVCEDNEVTLSDLGSVNGTYVNGNRVQNAKLLPGDSIYIMGMKIIIGKGFIAVNNPDELVNFNFNLFSKWNSQIVAAEDGSDDDIEDENDKNIFYRSPRFKRDIKKAVIKIDPPPTLSNNDDTPLMLLLGPSMTMGMASLFTGIYTINNVLSAGGKIGSAMPTLVMSMSMLLGTVLWPLITKRFEKKRKAEREVVRQTKYKKYLDEIRADIMEASIYQTEILHENNVPIEDCIDRIKSRHRNLWERSINHEDFGVIRLGIGDIPLDTEIKCPERKFTLDEDNLQNEMLGIGEEAKMLKQVPITTSLIKDNICGIIGPRELTTTFVKGLILQLSALQSYDELKLVFIFDKNDTDTWAFTKWLPHVWDNEKSIRFIAADNTEGKELSAYLENELQSRMSLSSNELIGIAPHYVIFACSKSVSEKVEAMNQILKSKTKCGFSVIALYNELNNLPKECSKVIEVSEDVSKIYDKNDITGQYTGFKADLFAANEEELAVELSNIQLNTLYSAYTLPGMLTFLEMFGVGKVEHLNILNRWKENDPSKTLETAVGVDSTGEIIKLDLHEKYHGPHGLVAGMTGSGKSEFIITYILSLAINYHPNEVAFILIDYKGGGMAKAFESLPHTVGIITNLDGTAVKRSLVSIQSELKRRQAIFNDASKSINVSNIDIYKYQKLFRERVVSEPLPHLFIISDEFAELKNQQPDFMQQLVSAARIGRSLGVHLILATQKPSGVVDDQIWSNSKFRVCLKVQEKADSMDMLKRPDAAELSATGRFYLQVGYNELFELGQSAWAGAPYYPSDKYEKQKDESVAVIDNLGKIIKQAAFEKKKNLKFNASKQIDEITNYLSVLAADEKIASRPLWLEPIPAIIYIDELKNKYSTREEKYILNPIVGEVDDPANQRQSVLQLPITKDGNTILYGVSGSGKTTFITTMIYSLISEHTPEEINLYLLDFGSETLKVFNKIPHVGDVFLSDEREKIHSLFKMLLSEMNSRKKKFSDFGGDFDTYLRSSEEKLASLVVVIQNYSAFSESYDEEEEALNILTREGTKYGIYFVITASSTNAVRYRMLQNFKQLIVLQLNDPSEYSGILGGTDGVFPTKYPGRGLLRTDKVYEFQTANITRNEKIRESISHFYKDDSNHIVNTTSINTPTLPDVIDTRYLAGFVNQCDMAAYPIGVETANSDIAYYSFDKSYINLVLSLDTGSVSFLSGLAEIASLKDQTEVIVLDALGSMCSGINYCCVSERTLLNQKVDDLFNILLERNNATKDAIEKGEEPPQYPTVICIINSLINLNIQLTMDAQGKLNILLEKGESSYNVFIFLSETSPNLVSYAQRDWYKRHITLDKWIWVGNGINSRYQDNSAQNAFQDTIGDDSGYVFDHGKTTLIKLLTAVCTNGEDGYDR